MDARTYLRETPREEVEAMCRRAGTKYSWFYQVALGHGNFHVKTAQRVVAESGNKIDLLSLIQATPDRQVSA